MASGEGTQQVKKGETKMEATITSIRNTSFALLSLGLSTVLAACGSGDS
jgi:hypothetical protein